MPGPAPKPADERRRRNKPQVVSLPAEGRVGDLPRFPFGDADDAERAVWAELWATPQAVMWERLGWIRVVARYVRLVVEAEKRKAQVTLAGEVRQLEDRLGLTPMSMKRLEWEIVTDEVAEHRAEKLDVRRLRAVDPAVVGD